MKIMFLGDVVGRPGRSILKQELKNLIEAHKPDLTIVNGENAAGGIGIEPAQAREILAAGADVITTGNHIWNKKTIDPYLESDADKIVRPLNYAQSSPGKGWLKKKLESGVEVAVVNLAGRVFMAELADCPFIAVDTLLRTELKDSTVVFVDFHCEATSEKNAMGYFLDGRASVVVGTHTHVQTADERILPEGTAYITDVGMCGPKTGVIGMDKKAIVERFLTGKPVRFEVASGDVTINGVVVEVDAESGKAKSIDRINNTYSK